jgi:transcriptional regulator with XRE-family HTH domain
MMEDAIDDRGFDLGGRLKAARELHGLTQRELASRTGISNAMISLIENNRTSPSVGLLKRLLGGIPLSLSAFFTHDFPPADQIFYEPGELTDISGDGRSTLQIGGNLTGRKIQMLYERHAPGADTGEMLLSHEGEEAGIVIEGRLEVTVAGRTRVLDPGSAYYFDSRLPHRFRNAGLGECIVVSACTPPSF